MAGTITLQQFSADTQRAAAALTAQQLAPALRVAGQMIVADVKQNFAGSHDPDGNAWRPLAHPRPSGGGKPLQDRGLLAASISAKAAGLTVTVGTNRPGASLHQAGGVVRATRAKFLTIPLTVAAQRAGTARRFPAPLHAVVSGAKGVLLDDRGDAQYALVKSVRVPARPFVGFGQRLIDRLGRMFAEFVERRLAGGR